MAKLKIVVKMLIHIGSIRINYISKSLKLEIFEKGGSI